MINSLEIGFGKLRLKVVCVYFRRMLRKACNYLSSLEATKNYSVVWWPLSSEFKISEKVKGNSSIIFPENKYNCSQIVDIKENDVLQGHYRLRPEGKLHLKKVIFFQTQAKIIISLRTPSWWLTNISLPVYYMTDNSRR